MNFFKTLDLHVSKLGHIVEEAQLVNDKKLSDFEKKFEVIEISQSQTNFLHLLARATIFKHLTFVQECAANEERQLLEKVAELLAGSNARKKQLVWVYIEGRFT